MIMGKVVREIKKWVYKKRLRTRGICISRAVDFLNVEFGDYTNFAHHAQVSNSKIGDRTSIGRYSKIQYATVGKYCSVSWDVTIGALEHPLHAVSTHAFSYRKQFGLCDEDKQIEHRQVIIGNDVWIGCGVIIMPGVKIGDGAVIGAGSVITKDVLPYEIVAGCPGKHISWRFDETIREQLCTLKWWDLDDSVIHNNIALFSSEINLQDNNEVMERLLLLCKENQNS